MGQGGLVLLPPMVKGGLVAQVAAVRRELVHTQAVMAGSVVAVDILHQVAAGAAVAGLAVVVGLASMRQVVALVALVAVEVLR